jgi:X-X-X-Leu-X-X-Gly heptad repeat protein
MSKDKKKKRLAAKLDEGATKLDEGASKLHEGAAVLHETAATMSDRGAEDAGETSASEARARIVHLRSSATHAGARAFELVKQHPVATIAALGAATALIEVELAAGVLLGVAAAALLVEQAGPEVRQRLLTSGRQTLARARSEWSSRTSAARNGAATSGAPGAGAADAAVA